MENNANSTTNKVTSTATTTAPVTGARPAYSGTKTPYAGRPGQSGGGRFSGPRKPGQGGRPGFVKPDIDYKILNIRRVARITRGGKRFTFSVAVVVGDKKGMVGVGIGKAGDTASAIEKAIKSGKKHTIKVKVTKSMSIPHESEAKYSSSRVALRPAKGRGLVAGSSARTVLTLAGITDVSSKFQSRTKNQLNNAQATVLALSKI
ncbi:MAG: 30S ribosomal protein S5 [bacterium]